MIFPDSSLSSDLARLVSFHQREKQQQQLGIINLAQVFACLKVKGEKLLSFFYFFYSRMHLMPNFHSQFVAKM